MQKIRLNDHSDFPSGLKSERTYKCISKLDYILKSFKCDCLNRKARVRIYTSNINTIKYIVYNIRTLNMETVNSFSKLIFFLNSII